MDATGLPSDDTAEMLRDSLRGFLEAHWSAAARAGRPSPDDISAIWTQARRAGGRRARLRSRRRRPSRNPGGDGGTWPRRMSGADVVGRAGQSCALGIAGRRRGGLARKAARRHGAWPLSASVRSIPIAMRARSASTAGARAGCFASSRRRQAARIFSWPSTSRSLPSFELDAPGVDLDADARHGRLGSVRGAAGFGAADASSARKRRSRRSPAQGQASVAGAGTRRGPAGVRAGRRLRQGASAVRATDRKVPGDPAQARERPDRARRRPAHPRSCGAVCTTLATATGAISPIARLPSAATRCGACRSRPSILSAPSAMPRSTRRRNISSACISTRSHSAGRRDARRRLASYSAGSTAARRCRNTISVRPATSCASEVRRWLDQNWSGDRKAAFDATAVRQA